MKSMVKGLVALMFGTLLWMNGGLVKEAHAQQCLPGGFILQSGDQVYCNYSDGTCWTHDPYAIPPDCQARYEQRQRQTNNSSNSGFETPSRQKLSSYGVFVYNKKKNVVEGSSKKGSNNEAVRAAYSKALCDKDGDCEVVSTYQNQCAALAWGTGFFESRGGMTEKAAKKSVLSACGQKAKNCRILISDCSLP